MTRDQMVDAQWQKYIKVHKGQKAQPKVVPLTGKGGK